MRNDSVRLLWSVAAVTEVTRRHCSILIIGDQLQ